ncbi:cupredoxin domain-containing protein [Patescibacteria group bacterium]|nr:cupredoxin domain-containing protein [Patescibacteria group bacterium]
MNKYIIIVIVLVLIIASGAVYRAKFVPEVEKAVVTGIERSISIVTFENTWAFEPEFIEADQGDKIIFTITNRDDYDHGFAIDAFGISQRMPAKSTIVIEFVVTQAGDFPYYCSVSCGSGLVDGEKRGHFNQVGRLHVKSIISETSDFGKTVSDEDFAKSARHASAVAPANEKAEELGYDVSNLEILFDEDNTLWGIYVDSEDIDVKELNLSEEQQYQSILYRDNDSNPVLWIFIDSFEGEVINVFEVGE